MTMRRVLTQGLAAGFAAATVFALCFLVVDVVQGVAFRTPVYMSRVLFPGMQLPAAANVALFTVLHFAAFGLAGIAAAGLLAAAEIKPNVGLGAIFGFLLFDLVFYGSVVLMGVNIVRALGWPQVMFANVIAGAALFGVLRAYQGLPVLDVRAVWQRSDVLREGVIGGCLGALTVAVVFLVVDALRARLFFTPAALGSALFYGASSAKEVVVSARVVLGYTIVHFAAFIAIGLIAAQLARAADRHSHVLFAAALLLVTLEVLSLGALAAMAAWLFDVVPWWSPILGNLLAAAIMAVYLLGEHPGLKQQLHRPIDEPVAI